MAKAISITQPSSFSPSGDITSVSDRWNTWLRKFEMYATASGISDDAQKRALLLHCAGDEVQDIFGTFQVGDTYNEAKEKLTEHFRPQMNVTYQRHLFRKQLQNESETVSQFVIRLRKLADTCAFGNEKDNFIRDQVVDKCLSNSLRKKLLSVKDLTLTGLLEIAQSKESSEFQASQIAEDSASAFMTRNVQISTSCTKQCSHKQRRQGSSTTTSKPQSYNTTGTEHKMTVTCSRCGLKGHKGHECRCTKGKTCFKCNKVGHFASVCRSQKNFSTHCIHETDQQHTESNAHATSDNTLITDCHCPDCIFVVGTDRHSLTSFSISGIPISMMIDSGASCNVLNGNDVKKLKEIGVHITRCNRWLHPYMSPPIHVKESIIADIQYKDSNPVRAEFLVTAGDQPSLLGKTTALQLGVLHVINQVSLPHSPKHILEQYSGLSRGIGKLKNHKVKIHIDKSVPPVARKHSRVPFHLRDKVEEELKRLEKEDIIEKVSGPTEWVSRIVTPPKPKNPSEIRICVDMREANKAVIRTRHVTPTIEELVTDLNGATVFSKIDLRSGYHQLELEPESRYITTFSTHCGLYQYKRLIFGLSSAAEIFQHTIQELLSDISGSKNVSDDIFCFGKGQADHDSALHATLSRLHESGLTVNEEKCEFNKSEIEFFGYIFSADGLRPDPKKVKALRDVSTPQNPSEVRSFLGMAQYSARFISNFATLTEPLRALTKQDAEWIWGEKEDSAFQAVKAALSENTTLAYFDPHKHTSIHVDASPVGIAGMLSQDGRPIAYASRSLTDVEQRYSQTEREALAVVWACEHFHVYVMGSDFTVVTDHKPLLGIWDKINPPTRIARWALRLTPYTFKLIYKAGKDNPADYMSRHPVEQTDGQSRHEQIAEEYVNFFIDSDTPSAVTLADIQSATAQDPTLQTVIKLVNSGRWYSASDITPENANLAALHSFKNVKDDLCVNAEQNIILKGTQLVIPAKLQKQIIKLAHEGHQGVSKTKSFIRSKVWFPGMDKAVEEEVEKCIPCQANTNRSIKEPLSMSELPKGPWQNLSIDFCGPLPSGDYLLVIIDEFSRYPVVEIIRSTSADCVIPVTDRVFAAFGYPEVVKTDNGPPFQSVQWKQFMKTSGITHRKITPCWPQANAQAEAFNKPLMKAIRAAQIEHKNWRRELTTFLRSYRCTPHTSTLFTPFRLLFDRDPKSKLPEVNSSKTHIIFPKTENDYSCLQHQDAQAKLKMKSYADNKNNACHSDIKPGDYVLVKQPKENKLSSAYSPSPMVVMKSNGSMITAQSMTDHSKQITRNSCRFHKLKHVPKNMPLESEHDSNIQTHSSMQYRHETPISVTNRHSPQNKPTADQNTMSPPPVTPHCRKALMPEFTSPQTQTLGSHTHVESHITQQHSTQNTDLPRRSARTHKPPAYLKDYVQCLS